MFRNVNKLTFATMLFAALAGSCLIVGCSGNSDDMAETQTKAEIDKNLEGLPPAPEELQKFQNPGPKKGGVR